jgi:hypothetical protein
MEIHRMMNGPAENDHAFSIELDVAKLNEAGDRLLIEGYLGELVEIVFVEDLLEINGFEGNLRIKLSEEELGALLSTERKYVQKGETKTKNGKPQNSGEVGE